MNLLTRLSVPAMTQLQAIMLIVAGFAMTALLFFFFPQDEGTGWHWSFAGLPFGLALAAVASSPRRRRGPKKRKPTI